MRPARPIPLLAGTLALGVLALGAEDAAFALADGGTAITVTMRY
jgi:hypothetical protein